MVCTICIETQVYLFLFFEYVKYTLYHEVDILIIARLKLFVKKMNLFFWKKSILRDACTLDSNLRNLFCMSLILCRDVLVVEEKSNK